MRPMPDIFGDLTKMPGFPFGLPQSAPSFRNTVQTGDLGGSQSWGKPPVPGVSSPVPMRLAGVQPGGVAVPPPDPLVGSGGTGALAGGPRGDALKPPLPPVRPPPQASGPPGAVGDPGLRSVYDTPPVRPPTMAEGGFGPDVPPQVPPPTMAEGGFGPELPVPTKIPTMAEGGYGPDVPVPGFMDRMKTMLNDKDFMAGAGGLAASMKNKNAPQLDMAISASGGGGDRLGAPNPGEAGKMLEALIAARSAAGPKVGPVPQYEPPEGLLKRR